MHRPIEYPITPRQSRPGATTVALLAIAAAIVSACGDATDRESGSTPATTPVVVAATTPGDAHSGTGTSTGTIVPQNVSYETAEAAFTEGRYEAATEMFGVYTNNTPTNPWGHYMLGLSAWKAGDPELAERGFESALALDSTHVKSLVNLGRVLLELDRPEEALVKVQRAVALDPRLPDAYRVLGRVRSELRQPDEAIAEYRRAIALDDRDVWAMNNMGLVLIRQGRFEEALGPLARAVELDGDVPLFRNNLGVALERTGHFSAAAEAYRGVLAIDSTYDKAAVSLARVEGRLDDPAVMPVDLVAIAGSFAAGVQEWRAEFAAESGSEEIVPTDSLGLVTPVVAVPE